MNLIKLPYFMYLNRQAWANSVDPDQTLQNAASDQGLHCHPVLHTFTGSELIEEKYKIKE